MPENIRQTTRDPIAYIKWAAAKKKCDDLVIRDYNNWRLPTVQELEHIHKSIEDNFQYVKTENYWTSEEKAGVLPSASAVRFCIKADKDKINGCAISQAGPMVIMKILKSQLSLCNKKIEIVNFHI